MVLHGKKEAGVHAEVVDVKIVEFIEQKFLITLFPTLTLCPFEGCELRQRRHGSLHP